MTNSASIFRTFLQTTSLKGWSRAVKSESLFLRVAWSVAVLFGLSCSFFFVQRLVVLYTSGKVVTAIIEDGMKVPFPDLTMCNDNPLANIPGMREAYENHTESWDHDANPTIHDMTTFLASVNLRHDQLHEAARSFIVDCRWFSFADHLAADHHGRDCRYLLQPTRPYPNKMCYTLRLREDSTTESFSHGFDVTEGRYDVKGVVFVIYLDDFLKTMLTEYELNLQSSYASGMIIHPHSPNTLPDLGEAVVIPPGHHVAISFENFQRILLGPPYSDCQKNAFLDEKWTGGAKINYSEEGCEGLCRQNYVIEQCQCLSNNIYSLPTQQDEYSFCESFEGDQHTPSPKRFCLHELELPRCHEECRVQCRSVSHEIHTYLQPWPQPAYQLSLYDKYIRNSSLAEIFAVYEEARRLLETDRDGSTAILNSTSLMRDNFIQLVIRYNSKRGTTYQDRPALDLAPMLGSLGGAFTLWSGLSFLVVFELFELLYKLAANKCCPREDSKLPEKQSPPEKITQNGLAIAMTDQDGGDHRMTKL